MKNDNSATMSMAVTQHSLQSFPRIISFECLNSL